MSVSELPGSAKTRTHGRHVPVEGKMQQDSLHPDVAVYVVRPIWTIRALSDFADDATIIFRYRPTFSRASALSN